MPRNLSKAEINQTESSAIAKRHVVKAAKDKNLLSFEQEDDDFEAPAAPRRGFTSVHEALAGKD